MSQTENDITIGDPMKGNLIVKQTDRKSYYPFPGFFLVVHRDGAGIVEVAVTFSTQPAFIPV